MAPCSDRLLALLDSANELVQIVTLEGDLSYVSSAWCRLLGYAAEEVMQRCFFDFVHLADRDRCRRSFQALQSGNDADVRVTLLGKQGEIRVHGRIRYEAGEAPEIWSLWHPIQTALERPEAADTPLQRQPLDRQPESPTLEWERSLLRCLMDSTPDVIFCKSQDGNYLGCNQAFAALAGRSQSEIVGRNDWEIFSEASAAFVHQKDRQVVEARQTHRSEEWATYPNGQRRLLDTIKTPVVGADGEVLGLIGICRDITDRAQAEDALRRSEEQRCLALDFSHIGSWDWNFATDTLTWNNNHYHILGLVPGHSPITPQIWRDFIHPDDLEQVEQIGATALSTYTNFEAEYRVIHLDGSVRWVVSRGRGVYNDRGDAVRMIGILIDISDHKQAEENILRALEKERELNELKSRFITMVSHEIRTPLTSILSSADILQHIPCTEAEEQELFVVIQESINHMVQLLENVLSIGLTETGEQEFKPTQFDLAEFCRALVRELEVGVGRQHRLTLCIEGDCDRGWFDKKLLRQLLNNLLTNATKYSPPGSTIEFRLSCHSGRAVFQIQDVGIGIPSADLSRLFECCHRASNVGAIKGTGLGLTIVKNCVERHGGDIAVETEVGKGTLFTVTLPLNLLATDAHDFSHRGRTCHSSQYLEDSELQGI